MQKVVNPTLVFSIKQNHIFVKFLNSEDSLQTYVQLFRLFMEFSIIKISFFCENKCDSHMIYRTNLEQWSEPETFDGQGTSVYKVVALISPVSPKRI